MKNELNNEIELYLSYDDELYIKYFNKGVLDNIKSSEMYRLLSDLFENMYPMDYHNPLDTVPAWVHYLPSFGYIDGYGYYIKYKKDNYVYIKPLKEDFLYVFSYLVKETIFVGSNYSANKFSEIRDIQLQKRFGSVPYEITKYIFCCEYSLDKFKEYYKNNYYEGKQIPEEIIEDYENYLNNLSFFKDYDIKFRYDGENFVTDNFKLIPLRKKINS